MVVAFGLIVGLDVDLGVALGVVEASTAVARGVGIVVGCVTNRGADVGIVAGVPEQAESSSARTPISSADRRDDIPSPWATFPGTLGDGDIRV